MYQFIDVTETPEGALLPSEALKINGEYIENLIPGYRTLTVEGREALTPELSTYNTGIRDGSLMSGKRYPARTIRVTYQLLCGTNEDFRAAFNKLGGILDVKDAELIFDDEPDKYFIGTPSRIGEVTPGRNSVIGEFDILCLDPFKYSVMEYEAAAEPGESSIFVDYKGTYKSYPKLAAEFFKESEASEDGETVTALTGSGDCGYVAFFNENEKIIQLGDPDEVDFDEDAFPSSQTLVNQTFSYRSDFNTAAKSLWAVNSGVTSSNAVVQTGDIGMCVATPQTRATPAQVVKEVFAGSSRLERPYINYRVVLTATARQENTVKLTVTVISSLEKKESYFGRGYELKADVKLLGQTKTFTIKEKLELWAGDLERRKSASFTLDVGSAAVTISDIKFKAYRTDDTGGKSGIFDEIRCAKFTIPAFSVDSAGTLYLSPTSYGTGTDWHGASVTRVIPADKAGDVGASNFNLIYSQKMGIGTDSAATQEYGAFQVLAVSGSGDSRRIVAGVNVYKGSVGKKAKLRFYVGGKVVETTDIDLTANNAHFQPGKSSQITKTGKSVTFVIPGVTKRIFTDDSISEAAVTEITFTFTRFGTKPGLKWNGLCSAKFIKDYCEVRKDIPNKFSANDVVEADCKTGDVTLNGVAAHSLGALGNDWEGFYLKPGLNQIGTSYSEWVSEGYEPTFKVKYREVYL